MLKAEPSPRASTSFSFSFLRPSKTTVPVASLLSLRGFGIMKTLNKDMGLFFTLSFIYENKNTKKFVLYALLAIFYFLPKNSLFSLKNLINEKAIILLFHKLRSNRRQEHSEWLRTINKENKRL
jgi:hypothetical protein